MATATSQGADVEALVRQRIRALRSAKGWSLDELAQRSLVNASTISRIETGGRRLALDQLAPIAKALGTSLDELVDSAGDDGDVVIRPRRDEVGCHTYWQLNREAAPNGLTVYKVRIEPTDDPPELKVHPGRDWFFVLSGTVELHLGDRHILVHAGHAADFATMTPHAMVARRRPAELISIFDQTGRHAHR
jgi:transcriptional regulator with XRE-family HTH domain